MATRALIAVLVLALLNAYTASRIIARWPLASQYLLVSWLIAVAFCALQLAGPFGDRLLFPKLREDHATLVSVLDWASYLALGIMSILFIYGLVTDVVTVVWKLIAVPTPSRAMDFDRRALLTLGAVTLGSIVVGIGQVEAGPVVRKVEIPLRNLPDSFNGFTIVQISDLHLGPTIGRGYTEKVVAIANGLNPDLIALTGDFVDGNVHELADDVAPIAGLKTKHGMFYITGNHEYYWGAPAWIEKFKQLGARVLLNEHVLIKQGDDAIVLAGVTDYSTLHLTPDIAMDPKKALVGAPEGLVKILLAHQPASYAKAYEAGFDLQLSGHTHSGQYFPFNLMIRFFQRYYKGLNRHETMWVYVSSGTGYWGPPLRTAVPSEITLITLRPLAV